MSDTAPTDNIAPDTVAPDAVTPNTAADNDTVGNNDPFQVGQLFAEALRAIAQETAAEQAEAHAVESMTATYQNYVQQYTDVFAKTWQSSMQVYQAEIDNWQAEMAKAQAALSRSAVLPTPPAPAINADHLQSLKDRLTGIKNEVAAKTGKVAARKSTATPPPVSPKPSTPKP